MAAGVLTWLEISQKYGIVVPSLVYMAPWCVFTVAALVLWARSPAEIRSMSSSDLKKNPFLSFTRSKLLFRGYIHSHHFICLNILGET